MNTVLLSLGTNQGNRLNNLQNALKHLEKRVGAIVKESNIYQTEAWGKTDQAAFLNMVILLKTPMDAVEVLNNSLAIEQDLGRIRTIKWGERSIDIDIILFNDLILNQANLQIPHASMHLRRFVLVPLVEIAPDAHHPIFLKNARTLLEECPDTLEVVIYEKKLNQE